MSRSVLALFFAAGLILALAAAYLESVPGYMDAEYYYGGGVRLAEGKGWTETVLWNYLDDPSGIPHPANVYWMPLASFLAVPGMVLINTPSFFAARLIMILLAALIAPLTAWISYQLFRNQKYAILSGFLALFPGFYLIYTTDTETFTPYLILGGLFLWAGFRNENILSLKDAFLLGILSGLMHLARADGILWLFGAVVLMGWRSLIHKKAGKAFLREVTSRVVLLAVGYGIIMSPWYIRNLWAFSNLFPPGTSRALWISDYNQLFSFPAGKLNFQAWIDAGWQLILRTRMDAIVDNLKNFLGAQGEVFLLPFILAGAYRLRDKKIVIFGWGMWVLTFVVMSLVFPLAGARGGFFHSGSALQLFFWLLAPAGLDVLIKWGSRARKWDRDSAWKVFAVGTVILSAGLSGFIFWQNVVGPDYNHPVWSAGAQQALQIEQLLTNLKINKDETVMINNPPGYFSATGRAAIVIPDGNPDTSLEVARRFQVKYLVLEKAHVDGMDSLYQSPQNQPLFNLIGRVDDAYLFKVGP